MTARELGRRAALLKLAVDGATTANFGASAPAPAPQPTSPLPAQPRPPAPSPAPGAAPPAQRQGLGGMLGGMMNPQGLAQIIGNPALQGITRPILSMGGVPLLAGGSDMLFHGGRNMKTLMQGKPQMG
jgi:hypothetical protein